MNAVEANQAAVRVRGAEDEPEYKRQYTTMLGWGARAQTTEYLEQEIVVELIFATDEDVAITTPQLAEMTGIPGTIVNGRLQSLLKRRIVKKAPASDALDNAYAGSVRKGAIAWKLSAASLRRVRED
jgi:hypothetical protein